MAIRSLVSFDSVYWQMEMGELYGEGHIDFNYSKLAVIVGLQHGSLLLIEPTKTFKIRTLIDNVTLSRSDFLLYHVNKR